MGSLGPTAGGAGRSMIWTVFAFCAVLVTVLALAIGMPGLWPVGLIAVLIGIWLVLDRRLSPRPPRGPR